MAGDEVLKYGQTFTEVRLDGNFEGSTRWVGYQAPHTSQLADLRLVTTGTGNGHHIHRIEFVKVLEHVAGHSFFRSGPNRTYFLVAFLRCQQTSAELGFYLLNFFFCSTDALVLGCGNSDVSNRNRRTRSGTILKTKLHDLVK